MALVPLLYDKLKELRRVEDRGHTFVTGRTTRQQRSFRETGDIAERMAGALAQLGLNSGDRVGLLLSDPAQFVAAFLACVHGGFVAVPISPPPVLGRADTYHERAGLIAKAANLKVLVSAGGAIATAELVVKQHPTLRLLDAEALNASGGHCPAANLKPTDICFIQFTSGSTGAPKGVLVDYGNLAENCGALAIQGLDANERDVAVSWLPMYHDMGLVGKVLATYSVGMPTVYIPTSLFIKYPSIWMEVISEFRGTITFAPNFALELASMRVRPSADGLDLSCLRAVGCGAEPINASTVRKFQECFARYGLRHDAVMPTYGMAEATLAICFSALGGSLKTLSVSRRALHEESRICGPESATDELEIVGCGRAFPGHEIQIRATDDQLLPDNCVGEIVVAGPSVTRGYLDAPEATAEAFGTGLLRTGDLGFLQDDELYICGRKKDLIIVNGANHHPQEIEWEIEADAIDGVRKGAVVAVGVNFGRGEELVLVAECARRQSEDALRAALRSRARARTGLLAGDVAIAAPGTLPKTTSGKLMRQEVKRRYLRGEYASERSGSLNVA